MSNKKRTTGRPSRYPLEFQRDAVAMVLDEKPEYANRRTNHCGSANLLPFPASASDRFLSNDMLRHA